MTFEELLMVIDPNGDNGEILEIEFKGNDEFNRVRSGCTEILGPLFNYQVNSIGVNDNCEQRIWLDPPKEEPKKEPPRWDIHEFDGCKNCESREWCDDAFWSTAPHCNKYGKGRPVKDYDVYPMTIVKDRYGGTYSGGVYTAWELDAEEIPEDIDSGDVSCHGFWLSNNKVVGLGRTPNEAAEDLQRKLAAERSDK